MKTGKPLSNRKVADIKKRIAAGEGLTEISKDLGIPRSTIWSIRRGLTHTEVPWPEEKVVPLDLTNEHIQKLESENVNLRDELRVAKSRVKHDRKSQGIISAMVEEVQRCKPFRPLRSQCDPRASKVKYNEDAVLLLGDGHHDQTVTLEECNGLEEYNFQISCARAERLVDRTLHWTQNILSSAYKFRTLNVFSLGDSTSGEIHGAKDRSEYRNQINNCLAIGQLHALMIRDLAPFFPQINVVCISGNHGRRSPRKDMHGANDNWDYLIAKHAQTLLRDTPNVAFTIPNSWSCNVDIDGVGFHLTHGDDVPGWSGVPFYGLVRRQRALMALAPVMGGTAPQYIAMGHHHIAGSLSDVNGELILNGAWVGTDAYAFNTFAGYRKPKQLLFGVNREHGVTWKTDINLRHESEKVGPQRYKVVI